jgi:hypothetical protein
MTQVQEQTFSLSQLIVENEVHGQGDLNLVIQRFDKCIYSQPIACMLEYLLMVYLQKFPWGIKICQELYEKVKPKRFQIPFKYCLNCTKIAIHPCICGMRVWYCGKTCRKAFLKEHKGYCYREKFVSPSPNLFFDDFIIHEKFERNINFTYHATYDPALQIASRIISILIWLNYRCAFYIQDHKQLNGCRWFIQRSIIFLRDCEDYSPRASLCIFAQSRLHVLTYVYTKIYPWGADIVSHITALIAFATDITGKEATTYCCAICGNPGFITCVENRCIKLMRECHHFEIDDYSAIITFNSLLKNKIIVPYAFREIIIVLKKFISWCTKHDELIFAQLIRNFLNLYSISFPDELNKFLTKYYNYIYDVCTRIHSDSTCPIYELTNALKKHLSIKPSSVPICIVCEKPAETICPCYLHVCICSRECQIIFYPDHKKHCHAARNLQLKLGNKITDSICL